MPDQKFTSIFGNRKSFLILEREFISSDHENLLNIVWIKVETFVFLNSNYVSRCTWLATQNPQALRETESGYQRWNVPGNKLCYNHISP